MSIHSEYVIVTTPYSFASVHNFSNDCFELFNLATIEYHSDLYLDFIGVSLFALDSGLDDVSFGTVRLTLELPKVLRGGNQINLVSVCKFYRFTDYLILFLASHMILWRQPVGFIIMIKGRLCF